VPAGAEMPTYVARRNRKGVWGQAIFNAKTGALARVEISPAKKRVGLCAAEGVDVATEIEDGHTRADVFWLGPPP
jgi:hypothetical protein